VYKSFKEMPIWNDAMNLAEEIFKLSESFPKKKDYGLTSQLRRVLLVYLPIQPKHIAEISNR